MQAAAYVCTDPFHCYGTTRWLGGTAGAFTNIRVQHIYNNDGDGFVNNEMWLGNAGYDAYVEAGYKANRATIRYFWSETKPDPLAPNRRVFLRHVLSDVPGNDFGQYVSVMLYNYGGGTYHIYINSPNFHFEDNATGNVPTMATVQIGLELVGTATGSAPEAWWTTNAWYTSDGQPHYQNTPPPHTSNTPWFVDDPPVHASWDPYPANSPNGGVWKASCCY